MKPSHTVALTATFMLLVVGPAWVFAQGGPPLLTDDPETPGSGNWEINAAFTVEKRSGETLFATPLLDVNYGLGERHQLKFEIPWLVLTEADRGTKNGLGNSLVGWKWRMADEKELGFAFSIYPQIEFNNAGSSSADRGLVDKGTDILLPVEFAKEFGPLGVNLEFGYSFRERHNDEWLYGLALSYALSDRLELLGEIHGTGAKELRHHELVFNLGARWKFSEHYVLLASVGRGVIAQAGDEPQLLSYFGIQFLF